MRKVCLFIATSLDGYIAGPSGEIDWLFSDEDYGYKEFYAGVEVIVMGRKTYDQCLLFDEWPYSGKEAHVLTRNPRHTVDPRVSFASEPVPVLVGRLRLGGEGKIWLVGGGEANRLFLEHDLVDELIVSVHPTMLGSGIPLVAGATVSRSFQLCSTRSFPSGLVQLAYERRQAAEPALAADAPQAAHR